MKRNKRLPVMLSCALFLTVISLILVMSEMEHAPVLPTEATHQPVTVFDGEPSPYCPLRTLIGTTSPRWLSEIKAQTTGKVTWLNMALEPGSLVKKGQTLLRLETSALKAELARAGSAVKQAELALEHEQHEQTVAVRMLSSAKASSYARRVPQLAAAKAALFQARRFYEYAEKQLNDAIIKAPFDAIVLSRQVSPFQFVETGQTVFGVASSLSLDVLVPLSEGDWSQLQAILPDAEILVVSKNKHRWQATVRYLSPQLDKSTRQRQLILSVQHPFQQQPRLLIDQQVWIEIKLPVSPNAMRLPSTSLTRDGQVWTVNQTNHLVKEDVSLLEENEQWVWVVFAHNPAESKKVVVYPLLSMLPGQQVSPENTEKEAAR